MTFTHSVASNNYGPAKWIVSANVYEGTHTTIAAALTSASSGDTIFIRPGTYTENITLKAGVNITAWPTDSSINGTGNVIINGTCTMTVAGSCTISGIQLQTNSAALLAVTGSAASIVNLENCYLNMSNNSGITFSSSSASSAINITNSDGNIGTTGITLYSHSSNGTLGFFFCNFYNSGSSTTASTCSAGVVNADNAYFTLPLTISSTGAATFNFCQFAIVNTTCLTAGGSGVQIFRYCFFGAGSASVVSIGTTCTLEYCEINSTNTNAITGAGTLIGNTISYTGTSSGVNVTTKTMLPFGITGTWTPNLQINNSNTGITYAAQVGGYTQIGNVVNFWLRVVLSSKGVASGIVTISNLPVASGSSGANMILPCGGWDSLTAAGYTFLGFLLAANSTVGQFVMSEVTGVGFVGITNTNIGNAFAVQMSGSYIVD